MAAKPKVTARTCGVRAKLTINLPPHLLAAARGVAKLRDTSVAELVREAIKQYVLQHAPLIQRELELLDAAAEFNRLGNSSDTPDQV